jgi:hypothetical protein
MLSIVTEAVGYQERERTDPPLACPFDGEPLRSSPDGGLFCLLGNYEWPRQPRII